MTQEIDDGGPVYPGEQGRDPVSGTWNQTWERGLSKRELFAAMAMGHLIAAPHLHATWDACAAQAVNAADALLSALRASAEVHDGR